MPPPAPHCSTSMSLACSTAQPCSCTHSVGGSTGWTHQPACVLSWVMIFIRAVKAAAEQAMSLMCLDKCIPPAPSVAHIAHLGVLRQHQRDVVQHPADLIGGRPATDNNSRARPAWLLPFKCCWHGQCLKGIQEATMCDCMKDLAHNLVDNTAELCRDHSICLAAVAACLPVAVNSPQIVGDRYGEG